MIQGSDDEKAEAAGAVANVCSFGALSRKLSGVISTEADEAGSSKANIASNKRLIGALIGLCKGSGGMRARAVGAIANMSLTEAVQDVLMEDRKSPDSHDPLLLLGTCCWKIVSYVFSTWLKCATSKNLNSTTVI